MKRLLVAAAAGALILAAWARQRLTETEAARRANRNPMAAKHDPPHYIVHLIHMEDAE